MKKIIPLIALLSIAAPVNAIPLKGLVPETFVLQEHQGLNPKIWEFVPSNPLRTVAHHSVPKKCEGEERCVELDIVVEGPRGNTYNPVGMDGKALVFESSFIQYVSTIKIQCNEKWTPFKIKYPHSIKTWAMDPVTGNRSHVTKVDHYSFYTVATYDFQKEMCKYSFSKERRQAIDFLDELACAFGPKYCDKK